MNDTHRTAESQPKRRYGRVYEDLWPKLIRCSPLEAKLFLLLSVKANRKYKPVGLVDANIAAIARVWMGTSPGSVRRALKRLDELGLVAYTYRRGGQGSTIRVLHYAEGVDHGDPDVDHDDPPPDHGDPPPGSSRSTYDPQPTEQKLFTDPRNDLRNDRNGGNGEKKPRRLPKPKVIWDEEEQEVRAVDKKWGEDFEARWIDKLGEPRFALQIRKLNAWLANPEKAHRRGPNSRLDQTMERWMLREME